MHWKEIAVLSFLLLAIFFALYSSRSLDDNRLTSWQDAFAFADLKTVVFLLAVVPLPAFFLAKSAFPGRHPAVFLFVFSYASAAIFWREPELIVDASRYFTQAKNLELYGAGYFLREWGRTIQAWTDMPAIPFLYGLLFRFFGESRVAVEMFTTLLFSLTVVLTYLTGKELWDETTGLLAGTLLMGIPYLFPQVPLMMVDLPSTFFLMLSVFLFMRGLERGGAMILLSACSVFVTFLSKYSAWLMLTVVPVVFAVYVIRGPSGERKRRLLRGLLAAAASAALIAVFFAYKYDVISEQLRLLIAYQKPGLRRWGESFLSTFFFQTVPLLTVAALCSVYRAFREKDLRYMIVLWLPLLILALRVERARYTIAAFPMLGLAAACGLMLFRNRARAKFVAFSIAASSIVIAACVFLPFLDHISLVNVKEAGEFLNRLPGNGIEVFTLPDDRPIVNPAVAVPILDLFAKKSIHYSYDQHFPTDSKEILTSPLRFSFEYRNPHYYAEGKPEKESAVVVIAGAERQALPDKIAEKAGKFRNVKVFDTSENVFVYKTFLRVYY